MSEPITELSNDIVDMLTKSATAPIWTLPDCWLQGTVVTFAGAAGAGKSSIIYAMMMALASGLPVLGGVIPASDPKRILIFDEENAPQEREHYIRRSWAGLMQDGEGPDLGLLIDNLWCLTGVLGGPDWADRARECIEIIQPHAVIYDTAGPCFNIQEENENSEATRIVQQLRKLNQLTDPVCTSVVLKHAKTRMGKGAGGPRMRGASAWEGAADQTQYVCKMSGRPRADKLNLTRLEPGKKRAFSLQQPIYITPRYTDEDRTGLVLTGSYEMSRDHKRATLEDDADAA